MARLRTLWYGIHLLYREVMKFLAVGGVGYVVDVSLFNLLRYGGGDGQGLLYDAPLTAKILSGAAATIVTYAGNRLWTFRHRARSGVAREYALFFLLNAIGVGIAAATLGFSHYVLGLQSPLADNISANIVGVALGSGFRFWSYRKWVFREIRHDLDETVASVADSPVSPA